MNRTAMTRQQNGSFINESLAQLRDTTPETLREMIATRLTQRQAEALYSIRTLYTANRPMTDAQINYLAILLASLLRDNALEDVAPEAILLPNLAEFVLRGTGPVRMATKHARDMDGECLIFRLKQARPGSKRLYVTVGLHKQYIGHIAAQQDLRPAAECTLAHIRGLQELNENPEKALRRYGKQTNICGICGRRLDNHVSVQLGYGPVCADNYGLPWGDQYLASNDTGANDVL